MILAKNYESLSKFVKVMHRILWPLFSGHDVYCNSVLIDSRVRILIT